MDSRKLCAYILGFPLVASIIILIISSVHIHDGCVRYDNCTYIDDIGMGQHGCVIDIPGTKYGCEHLFRPCPKTNRNICYVCDDFYCPLMSRSDYFAILPFMGMILSVVAIISLLLVSCAVFRAYKLQPNSYAQIQP